MTNVCKTTPYVLITAARNEQKYIVQTLESVIAQTVLPVRWIIVSDGSTDGTDNLVKEYARRHSFITFLRIDRAGEREFGSKAKAVSAWYRLLDGLDYDYIGILDADVAFERTYYEGVLQKLEDNPRLGIAGGVIFECDKDRPVRLLTTEEWSVSGPIQMFRRKCYEDIGGYLPLRNGIDAVAEVMARQKGYEVRAFAEFVVRHLRRTGREGQSIWRTYFRMGVQDYRLGYDYLFFASRFCRIPTHFALATSLMWAGQVHAIWPAHTKTKPHSNPT